MLRLPRVGGKRRLVTSSQIPASPFPKGDLQVENGLLITSAQGQLARNLSTIWAA